MPLLRFQLVWITKQVPYHFTTKEEDKAFAFDASLGKGTFCSLWTV